MNATTLHEALRLACAEVGILFKDVPADGRWHETDIEGDRRGKGDGRIKLFPDGEGGIVVNWKEGDPHPFFVDNGRKLTDAERAERERKRREAIDQAHAEEARRHAEAATKAATIWKAERPAPADFPYLARKGIQAHGAKVGADGWLLVPMRDTAGKLWNLERIAPEKPADGSADKKGLFGGRRTGCYFAIGTPEGAAALCICEGFATGASIHEATGRPVAVAFNAGNLEAVARALRAKFPDLALILCADDDAATPGNPGLTKAKEAARAVGGLLALPDFGAERTEKDTDFNDMAAHRGLEAVGRAIANARPPDMPEQGQAQENAPQGEYARTVELIRGCDVKPEPVSWLWDGWLAAGKMHVLGGAPGTGKTTISMALAATVTTGGRWPDGTRSIAGNVVIWSGEDDPADTLIPRLMLSGADMARVYFIGDIRECNERRSFDPAKDMEPLRRKLAEIGDVRLLIVGPIVSAVAGDSHKNAEVRRSLQPLADLARDMRCALLGITHFSKGTTGRDPVERITGSLAFGALARIVLVAAKHQEDGEEGRTVRLFCRAKSNIGPDDGGFQYDLHQDEACPGVFNSSVLWGEAVEGAARELLATADATGDDGEGGTLADAKRFLADLLADGPLPSKAVKADADGAGYSWSTIRRAQKALGIEPAKEGGHFGASKQQWLWRLPAEHAQREHLQGESLKMLKNAEDAQQKKVSTFREIEHLQQKTGHGRGGDMSAASIIREATADGLTLALSPAGTIKATEEASAVNRWLPILKEHKPDILAALKEAANDSHRNTATEPEPARACRTCVHRPPGWLSFQRAPCGDPVAAGLSDVEGVIRYSFDDGATCPAWKGNSHD